MVSTLIFVFLLMYAVGLWMVARVIAKAGFSRWWTIAALIPVVNLGMLWLFAFVDWPAVEDSTS